MQLKSLVLAAALVAGAVANQNAQSELQSLTAEQLGAMTNDEATLKCGALCSNICKRDLQEVEESQAPACSICKHFLSKTCGHKQKKPKKCRADDHACCRKHGGRNCGPPSKLPPPPPCRPGSPGCGGGRPPRPPPCRPGSPGCGGGRPPPPPCRPGSPGCGGVRPPRPCHGGKCGGEGNVKPHGGDYSEKPRGGDHHEKPHGGEDDENSYGGN